MNKSRRMLGLSLIEIMVALAIGTVLLLGLVQVFGASRTAYQLSEGMARVQENARFALEFLQRDIRMAGHYGCINDQAHLQTPGAMGVHFGTPAFGHPLDFTVSVQGYEAAGTGPGTTVQIGRTADPVAGLPAGVVALGPNPDSDVLILRYLTGAGAPVTAIAGDASSAEELTLAAGRADALTTDGVATPTLFGIADCSYVDVFSGALAGEVVTVSGASSATTDLAGRYTPHPSGQTMLYRAESIVYYVSDNPAGVPSLYRARFDGAAYVAEEMVEGIESLQLVFGLDRTADLAVDPPTGYIDNVAVASAGWDAVDWRRAGMVQVGILAASPSRAASEQAPARPVLGVQFTAPATNDGTYRAGYESTVALRNRLYGN